MYVIPDNAYPRNKRDCLISSPNEEWIFSQEWINNYPPTLKWIIILVYTSQAE